jgi:hypothetical protein
MLGVVELPARQNEQLGISFNLRGVRTVAGI